MSGDDGRDSSARFASIPVEGPLGDSFAPISRFQPLPPTTHPSPLTPDAVRQLAPLLSSAPVSRDLSLSLSLSLSLARPPVPTVHLVGRLLERKMERAIRYEK
uniref:Uncharacterized protein n=1 Tax=Plectus sambesii TaxID=2011161 RepID=A0A914XRU1_9BILA